MTTTTTSNQIDGKQLLAKLKPWVATLVDDMRACYVDDPAMKEAHAAATRAKRTAEAYPVWLDAELTQSAVAWVLAGVFIRFLEDQNLIEPRLTGPGDRHARAVEAERRYFGAHPTASYTDYWLAIFMEMHGYRATAMLYDEAHTPLWRVRPSGDQAKALLTFWRERDEAGAAPALQFDVPEQDTRFLGDLYQDLSEAARKRYALLQTPDFVEEFILDRTLEPAIATYGLAATTLIDPTCGSGHFLLGAFERLIRRWEAQAPGMSVRERVLKALDAVSGVDLNPFAVAISRFRLVVMALRAEGLTRLADAPAYELNVAVGDTLLHAPSPKAMALPLVFHTANEDAALLARIFGRRYSAVVGNPPYITVKDKALNQAYRDRYPESCHMQYSLGSPFTEVFLLLANPEQAARDAGFVGLITADSFMKREFGRKLIEVVLPRFDLTHVVSTSGAYIPGHGTPTVILLGRNRAPRTSTVRVVMGIQGEPEVPLDPAKGKVWTAIVRQIDSPGSESEYISVVDLDRDKLRRHPWSIGGGGASDLKVEIESRAKPLASFISEIGFVCMTRADELYSIDRATANRTGLANVIDAVEGTCVRDWSFESVPSCVFPYDADLSPVKIDEFKNRALLKYLWPHRSALWLRREPNGNHLEIGLTWWEWSRFQRKRYENPLTISFAEIATHNNFVFDRGGKVFKQTAPVIKLSAGATESDHLRLVGLLNSSTLCFWLKQVCFPKGGSGIGRGIQPEKWMERFAFDSTKVGTVPILGDTIELAAKLDEHARLLREHLPETVVARQQPERSILDHHIVEYEQIRGQLIALQEELDWRVYRLYGLLNEELEHHTPPALTLGERAFEIALARRVAAGEESTAWFERHGATPRLELPEHWPEDYRAVVERRLAAIESNSWIKLIEQPTYKRRWNQVPWVEQEQAALRKWILDRLESDALWRGEPSLVSVRDLATKVQGDAGLVAAIELYTGQAGADLLTVILPLVASEAVPFLAAHRYTDSGMRKRAVWEEIWDLQRREDAGEQIGPIAAPPAYKREDFQLDDSWRLRGALDVPKERFTSFPGLERLPDQSLIIGWAGWNHLQKAQAVAGYYMWAKEQEAWPKERLVPLLACLVEELPWLLQWHNDLVDGSRPAEDVAIFVDHELGELGMTREDARAWTPPAKEPRRAGRKKQL